MQKRKAMVMAAGKGTRLLPLTNERPKALVEFNGNTLLQSTLENLKKYNFFDVIVNIHHFPEMIREYLRDNHNFGLNISYSDETEELLETGGGLKKASWFFDSGPFLVHNVDVQTDLNLDKLFRYHQKHPSLATLALKERKTTRPFLMGKDNLLSGWRNELTGEEIIVRPEKELLPVGFSGVYVLEPEIFSFINETGKFSITPVLLRLAKEHKINMFLHKGSWKDYGTI